jgi:hypothetical protein
MTKACDICGKPCLEGQGLYGCPGDGGKSGPVFATGRHYACHVAKYGRAEPSSVAAALVARTTARPTVLKPVVRKGEYNRSENAARKFRVLRRESEHGRSRVEIECPFCFSRFWAFVWSISGGGKCCPNCRAKHASFGVAYPLEGNEAL